jgi:hypothetical protein
VLKTRENRPPASPEALRRRAEDDLGRLADAAHSLGYWSAHLAFAIDTKAEPAVVTVTVEPGPLYHVAAIAVLGPAEKTLDLPNSGPPLPLRLGDPARTAPVVDAESAFISAFAGASHPFAKAVGRRVVSNSGAHTMTVTYRSTPARSAVSAR